MSPQQAATGATGRWGGMRVKCSPCTPDTYMCTHPLLVVLVAPRRNFPVESTGSCFCRVAMLMAAHL
eukprot:3064651-Rhodomonas_salina.1